MSTANPRFPHTLTLTRVTAIAPDEPFLTAPAEDDPFAEETEAAPADVPAATTEEETIYAGECRSYRNVVTKTRDGVLVSDYVIAMPRVDFAILPGDRLVVAANNRTMVGTVVDSQITNLGTNIWWNKKGN